MSSNVRHAMYRKFALIDLNMSPNVNRYFESGKLVYMQLT